MNSILRLAFRFESYARYWNHRADFLCQLCWKQLEGNVFIPVQIQYLMLSREKNNSDKESLFLIHHLITDIVMSSLKQTITFMSGDKVWNEFEQMLLWAWVRPELISVLLSLNIVFTLCLIKMCSWRDRVTAEIKPFKDWSHYDRRRRRVESDPDTEWKAWRRISCTQLCTAWLFCVHSY